MNKIPGKQRLLSRLISLSVAGALIGGAGAYAADNQTVTGQEKVDAPRFSDVDRNQDQQIVWTEIYAIYDDELTGAGWEEQDVMDRYDADRNENLDENEYLVFVTALAADPSSNLSAESAQQDSSVAGIGQSPQTSTEMQSPTQQQSSSQQTQQDQMQQGQSQQDSSTQQSSSMAGTQQQQAEQDSSIAGTTEQQSATTQQQDSQEEPGVTATNQQGSQQMNGGQEPSAVGQQESDSIAGTTSQQDPGTAEYYDQESQTSTGGAQSPQQEQGMGDQSLTQSDQGLTQSDQGQSNQSQSDQTQSGAASGQQSTQQQGQADTTTTIIAITDIPDITAEDLRDRQVINLGGEEIGEVEDVVLGTDGVISGLVVGVGGFWDIGDKDVFASANELRVSGDQIIWETTLDEDALKELPEYERPEVSAIE